MGVSNPSLKASRTVFLACFVSALLTTQMMGVLWRLRYLAMSSSCGVMPVIPSIKNKTAAASLIAFSVCCHMLASSDPFSWCSKPAVSMSTRGYPAKEAVLSFRSRVRPGVASTKASGRPTSLLKSVDFPTLGRPTKAILGRGFGAIS